MKILKCIILTVSLFVFNQVSANSHRPQEILNNVKGSANEGQSIVENFCASCHAPHPLIEIGAPKINDAEQWSIRFKKGINSIIEHTESGFNMMPPRGGCFECDDEQLILAISAMLDSNTRKAFEKELSDLKKNKKIKQFIFMLN